MKRFTFIMKFNSHVHLGGSLIKVRQLIIAVIFGASLSAVSAADLKEAFQNPPDAARPGVYWYFMDGNMDRDEMVADLEAMSAVGIGSVFFPGSEYRDSHRPRAHPWCPEISREAAEGNPQQYLKQTKESQL